MRRLSKLFVLRREHSRGVAAACSIKFGLLMLADLCDRDCRLLDDAAPDGSAFVQVPLLAMVALFVAASARMYMWWGGSGAPARFLVPILPLAAPMIAVAFRGCDRRPRAWSPRCC
jgi:hypothetical protein